VVLLLVKEDLLLADVLHEFTVVYVPARIVAGATEKTVIGRAVA
jgi:hypothetical protein